MTPAGGRGQMMRTAMLAGVVIAAAVGLQPAAAAGKATALTCTGFMRDYPQNLPAFRVSFERPLTITRDLLGGEDEPGVDIHVLSDNADVDGTLRCRGDEFRRFELRIGTPADPQTETSFSQFQAAALQSVFHFDKGRTATILGAMSSDADEYLRASIQRGDTFNAGKVEYHQGAGFDLGLIWTPGDKTLIITSQGD